jgi:hypothetical protein
MAAEHGTISAYRGSATRKPCRCDVCRKAWAAYMKARRDRNVAERTKTRMAAREASSNIVAMPTRSSSLHDVAAPPVAAPDDDFEQEIMAFLDENGIANRALRARVRKQCQILRDPDLRGHWVAASRHLDELLVRVEGPVKKKKANQGRLAIIQQMAAKNDARKLDAMNAMGRRTAK